MAEKLLHKISAETEIEVHFNLLDPMNVVWHGNYINFFEEGRAALLDKIGYGYNEMKESGFAYPVTEVSVKYIHPVFYRDKIIVRAFLDEYENRIRIKFEIINKRTGVVTTKGTTTQMAFDLQKQSSCFICPQIWISKVEKLLRELKNES